MRGLVIIATMICASSFAASAAHASFPGQNGEIVFAHASQFGSGLEVVNPDGTGLKVLVATEPNTFDAQWSPDGTEVVYDEFNGGEGSILVVAAGGGSPRVVATGMPAAVVEGPSWTPDGRISWESWMPGPGGAACVHVEGETTPRFCSPSGLREFGRWSSDGRYAWVGNRTSASSSFVTADELDLVQPSGGDAAITATRVANFDWSPDGTRIVFSTGKEELGVVDADGTGEHLLGVKGAEPSWSPDGRKIVFDDGKGIAIVNADGSGLVKVTTSKDDIFPSWQPGARAYEPPAPAKGHGAKAGKGKRKGKGTRGGKP